VNTQTIWFGLAEKQVPLPEKNTVEGLTVAVYESGKHADASHVGEERYPHAWRSLKVMELHAQIVCSQQQPQ
jgi:hypothetical protein